MAIRGLATVWFGLVGVACKPWGEVSFEDEGQVCIREDAGMFVADVAAPECLSSSCTRDVEATCTATVEGMEIQITSDISWQEKQGKFAACTEDCGQALATCSIGPLADGTYRLVHGEEVRDLQIPLDPECPI